MREFRMKQFFLQNLNFSRKKFSVHGWVLWISAGGTLTTMKLRFKIYPAYCAQGGFFVFQTPRI